MSDFEKQLTKNHLPASKTDKSVAKPCVNCNRLTARVGVLLNDNTRYVGPACDKCLDHLQEQSAPKKAEMIPKMTVKPYPKTVQ